MNQRMRWVILSLAIVQAAVLATPAAQRETQLELSAATGYDSNPLELNRGGESGLFTQVALESLVGVQWGRRAGIFLETAGTTRLYESDVSTGDYGHANARGGVILVPFMRDGRKLTVSFGGTYALFRSTFVDPVTGLTYVIGSDPATADEIPDRFDFDRNGVFLDTRFRVARRVLVFVNTKLERRRFVEPYDDIAALQPLDDTTLTLEPGVRVKLSDRVGVELSVEMVDKDYAELNAVDPNASVIPGTRREYHDARLRAGLRVAASERWEVTFGLEGSRLNDTFAGYYDNRGAGAYARVAYAHSEKLRFRLQAARRGLRYEDAFINNDPTGDVRGGDDLRIVVLAERDLPARLAVSLEAGMQRTDNSDPIYAYDRNWVLTGLRWKL